MYRFTLTPAAIKTALEVLDGRLGAIKADPIGIVRPDATERLRDRVVHVVAIVEGDARAIRYYASNPEGDPIVTPGELRDLIDQLSPLPEDKIGD